MNPYRPLSLTLPSVPWGCPHGHMGWMGGWTRLSLTLKVEKPSLQPLESWIRSESPAGSPPWGLLLHRTDHAAALRPQARGVQDTPFPAASPSQHPPQPCFTMGTKRQKVLPSGHAEDTKAGGSPLLPKHMQ